MRWRRRLQVIVISVFVVTYAVLSHYGNSVATTRDLALGLALAPVLTLGLVFLWRSTPRWFALALALTAATCLIRFWPQLERNFSGVYLLQEGGLYCLMAASFGQSLFGRRVPLCTRLADKLHGPLSPQELRYTRRVTAAWMLFFVLIAGATLGLYKYAPLHMRSFFANFCVIPLMGLMFVLEYAVRGRALPQTQRLGIMDSVRIYFARPR